MPTGYAGVPLGRAPRSRVVGGWSVVDRAENADVELDEVGQFFTGLDLWAGLT